MDLRLGKITTAETALLAANLLPLLGVVCWGWSIGELFFLFWLENVIIGLMNIFRMAVYCLRNNVYGGVFVIPSFIFHYGMFTVVHGAFTLAIASGKLRMADDPAPPEGDPTLVDIFVDLVSRQEILLGVAALFASHFFSFIVNFIMRGEVATVTLGQLRFAPYGRVIILHVSLMIGLFIMMATGTAAGGLILLVIFKIFLDLAAHRAERARLGKVPADKIE